MSMPTSPSSLYTLRDGGIMIQIIPQTDTGPEWLMKIVNDFFIFEFSQLALYCLSWK